MVKPAPAIDFDALTAEELQEIIEAYDEKTQQDACTPKGLPITPVMEHLWGLVQEYALQGSEALQKQEDYLPLLLPTDDTPAIRALAMVTVLEALEEELEDSDED